MQRFHLTATYSTHADSEEEARAIFAQAMRDTPAALEIECEADPAPDAFDADNLPESYGLRIDGFRAFELMAPAELISRARRENPHASGWVLWDPHDGAEGLLMQDPDSGVLREEFADHARAHYLPPRPRA